MAISNLLSYLRSCHFPSHLSIKSDYSIFFICIFNFKISSLLLKDCINPFLSKVTLTNFFDLFLLLLCFPFVLFFLSLISLLFFDCLFPALISCYFLNNFRNIFHYITDLIRYIGVISIAHIILL